MATTTSHYGLNQYDDGDIPSWTGSVSTDNAKIDTAIADVASKIADLSTHVTQATSNASSALQSANSASTTANSALSASQAAQATANAVGGKIIHLTFTKLASANDTVTANGYVITHDGKSGLAVVGLRWVNGGRFASTLWQQVKLCTFAASGWKSTHDAYGGMFSNSNAAAESFECGTGDGEISWRASAVFTVNAGSWHSGGIIVPVNHA